MPISFQTIVIVVSIGIGQSRNWSLMVSLMVPVVSHPHSHGTFTTPHVHMCSNSRSVAWNKEMLKNIKEKWCLVKLLRSINSDYIIIVIIIIFGGCCVE